MQNILKYKKPNTERIKLYQEIKMKYYTKILIYVVPLNMILNPEKFDFYISELNCYTPYKTIKNT